MAEQIEKRERGAVSRRRLCQLSAVPRLKSAGRKQDVKDFQTPTHHSRNAGFKCFPHLSPPTTYPRTEREKRGFENETWDDRVVFGTAASFDGGFLQA